MLSDCEFVFEQIRFLAGRCTAELAERLDDRWRAALPSTAATLIREGRALRFVKDHAERQGCWR
jgi:hypothetical protein